MVVIALGSMVGQYRIDGRLGAGGMATVYRGYHAGLDRTVAIKMLSPHSASDPTFLERFRREARTVAHLRHPNILEVYDFGEREDGLFYIVNEYMEGGTLSKRLTSPVHPNLAIELVDQIAAGLDHAHSRGVLHRDIKPSNILFNSEGHAVIGDFGLAKVLEASAGVTRTGIVVGTPEYMAPEQGLDQPLDHRADVYALGVVLYRMLTGSVPFATETALATILAHVQRPLPSPRSINPAIPIEIEDVLVKALAKDPADRHQSAGELAEAYRQAVAGSKSLPLSGTHEMPAALASAAASGVLSAATPRPSMGVSPVDAPAARPVARRVSTGARVAAVIGAVVVVVGAVGLRFAGGPPGGESANLPGGKPPPAVVLPPSAVPTLPVVVEAPTVVPELVAVEPPIELANVEIVEEPAEPVAPAEASPLEAPAPLAAPPPSAPRPTVPRPVAQPPAPRAPIGETQVNEASVPNPAPAAAAPAQTGGGVVAPMGAPSSGDSGGPRITEPAQPPAQAAPPGVPVLPMGATAP